MEYTTWTGNRLPTGSIRLQPWVNHSAASVLPLPPAAELTWPRWEEIKRDGRYPGDVVLKLGMEWWASLPDFVEANIYGIDCVLEKHGSDYDGGQLPCCYHTSAPGAVGNYGPGWQKVENVRLVDPELARKLGTFSCPPPANVDPVAVAIEPVNDRQARARERTRANVTRRPPRRIPGMGPRRG